MSELQYSIAVDVCGCVRDREILESRKRWLSETDVPFPLLLHSSFTQAVWRPCPTPRLGQRARTCELVVLALDSLHPHLRRSLVPAGGVLVSVTLGQSPSSSESRHLNSFLVCTVYVRILQVHICLLNV